MADLTAFHCNRMFYGEPYFPYGLSRSGDFNRKQAALLESHGCAYEALHRGERQPQTPEEEAFVAMCHGDKAPETPHEKAWALYLAKINSRVTASAFGSTTATSDITDESAGDTLDVGFINDDSRGTFDHH